MSAAPKYTIYELLEAMVERIGWQSEQQRMDMLTTVRAASEVNAVGVIGNLMACPHNNTHEARVPQGNTQYYQTIRVCDDCERKLT